MTEQIFYFEIGDMFGFLRPNSCDAQYRRLYASCCSFQHRQFGIETLPLVSYEGVFLYVLAADSGACPSPDENAATCCRLRRKGRRLHPVDERLAMFCSCFGLLLASVKLEDDVRDDGSLLARIALWRLGSRIDKANRHFENLAPGFRERIREHISQHLALERAAGRPTLDEYAAPTAAAFGLLFELFAPLISPRAGKHRLRAIGEGVGRAIICFDCAADWERDRRRNHFNPLPDRTAVDDALLESQRWLSRVGWLCAEAFGPHAHAAAIAGATFDRIPARADRCDSNIPRPRVPLRARLARRRGDCDCLCDPSCCDCPSGGDGAADACLCCCADCDCCCDWARHRSQKRKEVQNAPRKGWFGRALGPLSPAGVALFGQDRVPALAEDGRIESESHVEVVRVEPFGVVVRPARS